MKILFVFAYLLITIVVMGQSSSEKDYQNKEKITNLVLKDDDPNFKLTEIPDSFKNESAVILCQKSVFHFVENAAISRIKCKSLIRRRVKLNDKSAVAVFSEFFYTADESAVVGISVIKPNGSEISIDTKQAIVIKEEEGKRIPDYYKKNAYLGKSKYKKIAIAGLEPGDIVDYFLVENFIVTYVDFSTIVSSFFNLSMQYPIMKQVYEYSLNKNLRINIRSLNCASKIEEVKTSVVIDNDNKEGRVFKLEDYNRPKGSDERWRFPFNQDPIVKCQIYVVKPDKEKISPYYVEKKTVIRSEVQKQEVVNVFCQNFAPYFLFKYKGDLPNSITSLNNKKEIVEKTFYFLRSKYIAEGLTKEDFSKLSQVEYAFLTEEPSKLYMSKFAAVMRIMKIPYEIVLIMPRTMGKMADIIEPDELEYGIRIELDNDNYQYIIGGSLLSDLNHYPFYLEGADMIVINQPKNYTYNLKTIPKNISVLKFPQSTSKDNLFSCKININIDTDAEYTEFKADYTIGGEFKKYYSQAALMNFNLISEDYSYINMDKSKMRDIEKKITLKEESKTAIGEKQKKEMKDILEKDYSVNELKSIILINSGRIHTKPELQYTTEFTIKNPFNKAGKNLIFEIGSLAGSQAALEEKEKVRKNDIYFENARTIAYDISISIPEGYSVENLESVNTLVDNECCSFKATATLEDSVIHLVTEKVYKHNFDTKDKWPLYVEMLEAAYAFSQKKVILKKTM